MADGARVAVYFIVVSSLTHKQTTHTDTIVMNLWKNVSFSKAFQLTYNSAFVRYADMTS